MRKGLEIGGIVAAVVLIVFGIVFDRDGDRRSRHRYDIAGTGEHRRLARHDAGSDHSGGQGSRPGDRASTCRPATSRNSRSTAATAPAASPPTCAIHALEATGGYTYAEMGRYEAKPNTPKSELAAGGGTEDEKFAVIDPETGEPAENGARNVWVTETALATALNTSYMADTAVAVRHRDRDRPAADRDRLRRARRQRVGARPGHRAELPPLAQAARPPSCGAPGD